LDYSGRKKVYEAYLEPYTLEDENEGKAKREIEKKNKNRKFERNENME